MTQTPLQTELRARSILLSLQSAWGVDEDGLLMQLAADEIAVLREILTETVNLYGKPGGPWNIPNDPGGWLDRARRVLKNNACNPQSPD